jgi:hypothetical protein
MALARTAIRTPRLIAPQKEYVVGAVHTNTIEGFWSIIKRGISLAHSTTLGKYLHL